MLFTFWTQIHIFGFPCLLNKKNTTFMKRNFTRNATWACLVIAQANQVYFGFCLVMPRKEIWDK